MPLELTPVTQIHSDLPPCKVQVRIARIWSYHKQFKPTEITGLDLVLVDEKGDRIQASIRAHLVSKFQKQLKEGECYMIMNFEILVNCGSYRASTHPYKINFMHMTCVKKSEEISNLASRFNFLSFPEIQNRPDNDNVLIDVIGEIIGMNELKDVNVSGRQTKLLSLQLKDLGESIINVTLWEKWAEDVSSYVKCHKVGPIILVGSLMKTKPYSGNITVQNSSFSTKLFINSQIAEIDEFKESLMKSKHQSSSIITTITPQSFRRNSKTSFSLTDKRVLDQITEMKEGATCNIVALLSAISTDDDWFYIGCKRCFKKVSPFFNPETEEIEADKFSCDKCVISITTPVTRYKLKVKVVDDSGTASFIIFDQEVISLINKSAYELLEQQVQFNRSGKIPQDLLDLEGREFVFTILAKDTARYTTSTAFKVLEVTNDPEIIQKFKDSVMEIETNDMSITMVPNISIPSISEAPTETESTDVSTPSNATINQIENVSSEAANFDDSNTSVKTCLSSKISKQKRALDLSDASTVQQSSTKSTRPRVLSAAQIKKEKK